MYRLLRKLVLSAIAVHLVGGCCLHHAHGEFAEPFSASDAVACCGHGHCPAQEHGQPGPPEDPCDGPHCVFVALPRVNPDSPDTFTDPGVPTDFAGIDVLVPSDSVQRYADDRSLQPASCLRLHLLHCVLLI